jgi:hypothetical protein
MQYAHWLMLAGGVLAVVGFIGFALHKNDAGDTSSETIQAALEKAEAALEAKLKANGK